MIVAIVNFVLSLGFASYGMAIFAELGATSTLLVIIFLWAVLSGFCGLCVVYWVARDGDRLNDIEARTDSLRADINNLRGVAEETTQEQVEKIQTQTVSPVDRIEEMKALLIERYRREGYVHPELLLQSKLKTKIDAGSTPEQALQELLKEQLA